MANYLPAYFGLEAKEQTYQIVNQNKPILTVVGSVNVNSRNQLNKLLADKSAYAIEIDSYKAVSSLGERKEEEQRVYNEVKKNKWQVDMILFYTLPVNVTTSIMHEKLAKVMVTILLKQAGRL